MKVANRGVVVRSAPLLAAATATMAAYLFLIRPWHTRWGAMDMEVRRPMPGDDLVKRPWIVATRAVTIDAPPAKVWPWLVQMGYRRAGWYSYDRFDNDNVHVYRIIPELQHIAVGDKMLTDSGSGFTVMDLDPNRLLVLAVDESYAHISSVLMLEPIGEDKTRLVMRLRARFSLRTLPFYALFDFGDFVMMRKMMLGIKERAEREPLSPEYTHHRDGDQPLPAQGQTRGRRPAEVHPVAA